MGDFYGELKSERESDIVKDVVFYKVKWNF